MKSIGGYFELELRKEMHYHKNALKLNTARNCFEYVLRAHKYQKVYIPYYTCDVLLYPLKKCGVEYEFYHINEHMEPLECYELKTNEAFLYTNYYGLKSECVKSLFGKYGKHLIIDNSQAFYDSPLDNIDTFYSARKFFGVPDGAYLYTDTSLNCDLKQDTSYERMSHLLKRIEIDAEFGYLDFLENETHLNDLPIRVMSNLTNSILSSINYEKIKKCRQENYMYLASFLDSTNNLFLPYSHNMVPMVYPYFSLDQSLRSRLIKNKVYIAKYWSNVLEWCNFDDIEYRFVENILPLPIDQRIEKKDLEFILEILKG